MHHELTSRQSVDKKVEDWSCNLFLLANSWNCLPFAFRIRSLCQGTPPTRYDGLFVVRNMKSQNKILKEKFLLDFSQDTVVCFIIMFLYWDIKILKSRTIQELCSHTQTHVHLYLLLSPIIQIPQSKHVWNSVGFYWIWMLRNDWYFVVRDNFYSQTPQYFQLIICSSTVFKCSNSICNYHISKYFWLCSKLANYWGD